MKTPDEQIEELDWLDKLVKEFVNKGIFEAAWDLNAEKIRLTGAAEFTKAVRERFAQERDRAVLEARIDELKQAVDRHDIFEVDADDRIAEIRGKLKEGR